MGQQYLLQCNFSASVQQKLQEKLQKKMYIVRNFVYVCTYKCLNAWRTFMHMCTYKYLSAWRTLVSAHYTETRCITMLKQIQSEII